MEITKLIALVLENPKHFIANVNLFELYGFLNGYKLCQYELTGTLDSEQGTKLLPLRMEFFDEYVRARLEESSTHYGWFKTILMATANEDRANLFDLGGKAYYRFAGLFDSFYTAKPAKYCKASLNEESRTYYRKFKNTLKRENGNENLLYGIIYENAQAAHIIKLTSIPQYLLCIEDENRVLLRNKLYRTESEAKEEAGRLFGVAGIWIDISGNENIDFKKTIIYETREE